MEANYQSRPDSSTERKTEEEIGVLPLAQWSELTARNIGMCDWTTIINKVVHIYSHALHVIDELVAVPMDEVVSVWLIKLIFYNYNTYYSDQ